MSGVNATLTSVDDVSVTVPVEVAMMSETVRNLIEDAGTENPIPLPNVTGDVLTKVVEYCTYHTEHPAAVSEEKRSDDISPWDLDFCKVDQARLFELILAANYLGKNTHPNGPLRGAGLRPEGTHTNGAALRAERRVPRSGPMEHSHTHSHHS